MKEFNNLQELQKRILNISDFMSCSDVEHITYEDCFSEFIMCEIAAIFGGGLPNDYFNMTELTEIENIFRRIYYANKELSNLLYNIKNKTK